MFLSILVRSICVKSKIFYLSTKSFFAELSKQMLSNVLQYDALQKLDLSNNSLTELENLLQVA